MRPEVNTSQHQHIIPSTSHMSCHLEEREREQLHIHPFSLIHHTPPPHHQHRSHSTTKISIRNNQNTRDHPHSIPLWTVDVKHHADTKAAKTKLTETQQNINININIVGSLAQFHTGIRARDYRAFAFLGFKSHTYPATVHRLPHKLLLNHKRLLVTRTIFPQTTTSP